MKHLFKFSLVAFLALTTAVSSCNKYDEGSNFSLLTAKMRIVNDWKSTSYTETTSIGTYSSDFLNLNILKDGSYIQDATTYSFTDDQTGTWTFNSDKTQLLLTDASGDLTTWDIVKLKSSELKLTRVENVAGTDVTHTVELGE